MIDTATYLVFTLIGFISGILITSLAFLLHGLHFPISDVDPNKPEYSDQDDQFMVDLVNKSKEKYNV